MCLKILAVLCLGHKKALCTQLTILVEPWWGFLPWELSKGLRAWFWADRSTSSVGLWVKLPSRLGSQQNCQLSLGWALGKSATSSWPTYKWKPLISGAWVQTKRHLSHWELLTYSPLKWQRRGTQRVLHCFSFCLNVVRSLLQVLPLPPNVLNNKIQASKFEDLTYFVKQLMNWAAPHVTNRMLQRVTWSGRFFIGWWGQERY